MAEDPIPLSEQARYHLGLDPETPARADFLTSGSSEGERDRPASGTSDIPVEAAFEPSVDDQIAKSSVNPSREDLLAEGAKQARIYGVGPECAGVYASGWARAAEAAQEKLDRLLQLWAEQTTTIRIEPGQVLAIGGLRDFESHDLDAVTADLKQQAGAEAIWLFSEDIDIQVLDRAEQERITRLERQRQAVLDACNEADKPVKCRHCGPDIVAGDWSCMQCNNTGWWSAPMALTTAQIRDLLEEQK